MMLSQEAGTVCQQATGRQVAGPARQEGGLKRRETGSWVRGSG